MAINDAEQFYPKTQNEWRQWLKKHHVEKDSVWLILCKKKSNLPTISWSQAVDEALCFGWIDSVKRKLDEDRSIQYFSKRKPKGTWSKVNKEKVDVLVASGKMTPAGMACIEIAKSNGSWEFLDSVDAMIVPKDLETALKAIPDAMDYFSSLSNSIKKMMLYWLVSAKREETRLKRLSEIVECAAKKEKPKRF